MATVVNMDPTIPMWATGRMYGMAFWCNARLMPVFTLGRVNRMTAESR